jgi:hypothetical protein
MATRRSTRVTQVSPWIPGGEGQLRDLLPLPPWLFLLGRAILHAFRHYLISLTLILSVYFWIWQDWNFFLAFILFPILVLLVHFLIITSWLWYKNPSIPLIAKKPPR